MTAKVHFVIDEAASVGALPPVLDALDKYRSYGVRLLLGYQSMGQLYECWPDGKAQVLLSNTTQVFFGVQDNQTADYVSAKLGATTIQVGSTTDTSGRSQGPNSTGTTYSSGRSTTWTYQKRELLQPAEVAALPLSTAITFTQGLPPIATKIVRSFEEPALYSGRCREFMSSGVLLLRSAGILFFGLLFACMAVDTAQDRQQRSPTPTVGEWRMNGKGQNVDWQIGGPPGRTR